MIKKMPVKTPLSLFQKFIFKVQDALQNELLVNSFLQRFLNKNYIF